MSESPAFNMRFIWTTTFVSAMGGLLFGYDWVVIGGAKPFYEKFFGLTTPSRIGWAMSVSTFSLWSAFFVLTYTFPLLNKSFGPAGTFWIYAGTSVLGFIFIRSRVRETKGKTLEQIEREFVGSRTS